MRSIILDPIYNTDMIYLKVTTYLTKAQTINVHSDSPGTHFISYFTTPNTRIHREYIRPGINSLVILTRNTVPLDFHLR